MPVSRENIPIINCGEYLRTPVNVKSVKNFLSNTAEIISESTGISRKEPAGKKLPYGIAHCFHVNHINYTASGFEKHKFYSDILTGHTSDSSSNIVIDYRISGTGYKKLRVIRNLKIKQRKFFIPDYTRIFCLRLPVRISIK